MEIHLLTFFYGLSSEYFLIVFLFFYLILQLLKNFPKDLSSLKRAQVLCFYLGSADLSLALVQQVPFLPKNVAFLLTKHMRTFFPPFSKGKKNLLEIK